MHGVSLLDASQYFDGTWPFMRPRVGEELDGNAISYSSILAHLMIDEGGAQEAQRMLREIYKQAATFPGYLTRGPHKAKDRQTHDDVVHFVTAARCAGGLSDEITDIYELLKIMGWSYYAEKPKTFKERFQVWLIRIPGFKSVVKYAAGRRLSLLEKLWLLFDIWTTTREEADSTSGRLMDWAKYRMLRGERGILGLACRIFERDIKRRYTHLMGDVFQIYFQRDSKLEQTPVHIFAIMMQNRM